MGRISPTGARVFFQRGPGFGPVLLAPVRIVAPLLERLAKLLSFRIGKKAALALELRPQSSIYFRTILPLLGAAASKLRSVDCWTVAAPNILPSTTSAM